MNPFTLWSQYRRSQAASRYAENHAAPGMTFNRFGKEVGRRLLCRGDTRGLSYLLTPVSSFRYFELPFALAALPLQSQRFLDIASPRLFSLYVARKYVNCQINAINPDNRDIEETRVIARLLDLKNISMEARAVDTLEPTGLPYDCITSLSVIEHIPGDGADAEAVARMFSLLRAGGRLIVTVPVDRCYWLEYREHDYYGTAGGKKTEGYFFQRYYDDQSLKTLFASLPQASCQTCWFGERIAGRFVEQGHHVTVEDPREFIDYYQEYPSWEAMPGKGVCGLVFEK
jgi:2-polyprenyl-3-methyl-5-hydroxy-6-metoxy-1,4-benzoquinol methylase